ncbi:MAG: rRNA maturation RNase YbeY [Pseudomonadota bacterium]
MKTRILLTDRQRTHGIDPDRLQSAISSIAAELWPGSVEISVTLLGRRAMAAANRAYRGTLGPTDQISFPMPSDLPTADGVTLVGDLLICPAVIADQCRTPPPDGRTATGTPDRELALVLCHGLLHLQGHTHAGADDTVAMIAAEKRLLAAHVSALAGAYVLP